MATNGTVVTAEPAEHFALARLADQIAHSIARGLVVAMKELEDHIASETRKIGDSVDRRMDTLQAAVGDLSKLAAEQQSANAAVERRLYELAEGAREAEARQAAEVAAVHKEARESSASLGRRIDATVAAQQEADAKQAVDLAALATETRTFSQSISERIETMCREIGVQQEDLAAAKTALGDFSTRMDALVERLDRQGDTVRSMCTAYSQRESELEQLVDGLVRLRAFPTPLPANAL